VCNLTVEVMCVYCLSISIAAWHRVPNSSSMRLMFLMGLFCGVVTYVAYSGAIVSTLAVTIVPVKQFMQLIQYKFTFTVHEWSEPFEVFLKVSNIILKSKVAA